MYRYRKIRLVRRKRLSHSMTVNNNAANGSIIDARGAHNKRAIKRWQLERRFHVRHGDACRQCTVSKKKKEKKTSLESELVTDSSRPPLNRIERTFIRIISPRMLKKKHFTFLFSIAFTLSRLSRGTIVESMIGPFLSLSLSLFPFFFFRLLIRAYIENVSRNASWLVVLGHMLNKPSARSTVPIRIMERVRACAGIHTRMRIRVPKLGIVCYNQSYNCNNQLLPRYINLQNYNSIFWDEL